MNKIFYSYIGHRFSGIRSFQPASQLQRSRLLSKKDLEPMIKMAQQTSTQGIDIRSFEGTIILL